MDATMKTIKNLMLAATLTALCAGASPAWAQAKPATEMTDAEVRRVDKDYGRVTLKHGDIKNLDMPAMTMVFVVKDKAMLANLKAGDKIRFKAISEGSNLVVTEIAPAK
jgi:Cu/Ag efflux protein CusF